MKTFNVEIKGTSPYLMHRFSEEAAQGARTRRVQVEVDDPRTEATKVAYLDDDGHLYFSGASIPGTMSVAGASHKKKGAGRSTLRHEVPKAVRMTDDVIYFRSIETGEKLSDFEVDSRPVTIPSTKGRIMRHRPRIDNWKAEFTLVVNDDLISEDMAHQLLNEAGVVSGIGDFRPSKSGPFGCFLVTKFEEVTD